MSLSLFGIILGLVLLMFLAYKGYSIIWVAPVCAVVVAVLSGYAILDAYIGDYMKGMADYVLQWFPAFFLGAVYGKVMDLTGSARSLGVVFVIYPMGYSIYRAADLPRTLLPGAIATGAFGITMTAVPGTPQIQNLIPTDYYGTTTMAAPLLSLVACAVMLLPAYIYLEWRVRQSRRKGLHFVPDPKHKEVDHDSKALPSWHWVTGIVPLVVVVLMLNLFPWLLNRFAGIELASNYAIVIALVCGILVACLLNLNQAKTLLPAINEGANGSMGAIMNTACAVGFGSVVKVVPGFASLTSIALNMPGSILFSEWPSICWPAPPARPPAACPSPCPPWAPSTPKWLRATPAFWRPCTASPPSPPAAWTPCPTTARCSPCWPCPTVPTRSPTSTSVSRPVSFRWYPLWGWP